MVISKHYRHKMMIHFCESNTMLTFIKFRYQIGNLVRTSSIKISIQNAKENYLMAVEK